MDEERWKDEWKDKMGKIRELKKGRITIKR